MATNKRKEAAALFELIDKSTLKVPKHAGALKIPDWWSSKSNPASDAAKLPDADEIPLPDLPPAPTQARLFEPPPPGAAPLNSPSIRPPSANGAIRIAVTPGSATPAAPTPPSTEPRTFARESVPPEIPTSERPAGPRLFAPQTMEQGGQPRTPWGGQHKRRMARTPKWILLAFAAGILLVIVLLVSIVWIAKRHSGSTADSGNGSTFQNASSGQSSDSGNAGGGSILPPPRRNSPLPPVGPANPDNAGGTAPVSPDGDSGTTTAQVYAPGTVTRSPDLYYIVISSTPTASVAQKNADFLARHGVDVSIEVVANGAKARWYKLISVKGFPTMVAAEPFRKQIVQIGHLTADFRNHKKVWDDAFVTRLTMLTK